MTLTELINFINTRDLKKGAFYQFIYTGEIKALAKAKKDGATITRKKVFSARLLGEDGYTKMKVNDGRDDFNRQWGERNGLVIENGEKTYIELQENPNSKTTTTYYLNGVETTYAALMEMGYVSTSKPKPWCVNWRDLSMKEHVKTFATEQEGIDWAIANNSKECMILSPKPYINYTRTYLLDGLTLVMRI